MAFVNVSQDSAKSTNNDMSEFWDRIHSSYLELSKNCPECQKQPHRPASSLRSRWQKHIQKTVNRFNYYYKRLKEVPKSGWNDDKYYEEAMENFLEAEGKRFPFVKCCKFLHGIPKFDPMLKEEKQDKKTGDITVDLTNIAGQNLAKPLGQKAAKAIKSGKKLDAASLATLETSKVASIVEMNNSSKRMARSMEFQSEISGFQAQLQTITDQAQLYVRLNMNERAMDLMRQAEVALEMRNIVWNSFPSNLGTVPR